MKSETEILTVRVPSGTKSRLAAAAVARKTKTAALVNALLLALLDDEVEGGAVVPASHQLQLRRAEFCIPEFLRDALRKRAAEEGFKPARWVSLLVQANLMEGGLLTDAELLGVREAGRHLAALDRSLIKTNMALRERRDSHESRDASDLAVKELIVSIRDSVEMLRSRIDGLVVMRSRAWGRNDTGP